MKAFIVHNGKILILRESSKNPVGTKVGQYDIVGGRIEPGERWDDCLRREIQEETGLAVKIGKPFHVGEWRPVVKGEPWQIVAVFFECFSDSDKVVLSNDHDNFLWINPQEYKKHTLIENLISAFEAYLKK